MCEKTAPSFVSYLGPIGAFFFTFFGPFKAIFGVGVRLQKTFLALTYVDNQLWFLSTIFVTLPGYFWGQGQVKKNSGPTYVDNKLCF